MLLKQWNELKVLSNKYTQPQKRTRFQRYALPLILLIFLILIKILFNSFISNTTPFLTFSFAVVISAWYGGLGPGIMVTALSGIIANYIYLSPLPHTSYNFKLAIVQTLIFFVEGVFVSIISEAKRQNDIQKDEFIAFASHELKNPLTVIKGYAEIIQDAKKISHDSIKKFSQTIDDYADKATGLINELMDVSRIESGKVTLHKELFNVSTLVKKIVDEQKIIYANHAIFFHNSNGKNCLMFGDPYRISQVMVNLIANAVKYSPKKKRINIRLSRYRNFVTISVQDYGIGISADNQSRIFDRFYRAMEMDHVEGLGLGLYISREIVDMHHGKIWVKSQPGKGSTFFIKLPLKK